MQRSRDKDKSLETYGFKAFITGADGGGRTHTMLPSRDFELYEVKPPPPD